MRQPREMPQRVQIGELGEVVGGQGQGGQVGEGGRERGLDAVESVAGEEEDAEARGEGEVGEGGDVVVGEVDGVLVLHTFFTTVFSGRKKGFSVRFFFV